eukprot:3460510-Alexandrium_andersonii.AAC.1
MRARIVRLAAGHPGPAQAAAGRRAQVLGWVVKPNEHLVLKALVGEVPGFGASGIAAGRLGDVRGASRAARLACVRSDANR